MKKAGIRDVALRAGISTATVSHVLNNTRFVSEGTKQRVLDSIKELNYSPNEMARSFKTGKKHLIGFIVPDITNDYYSSIIDGIECVINPYGYRLVIANTKETVEKELDNLSALSNGIVDAVIIASTLESYSPIKKIVPSDIPVLCIDRTVPDCPYSTITVANYDAMYRGVTHLINKGHRKIAYITGLMRLSTTSDRLSAYKAALADSNIPLDISLVRYCTSLKDDAYQQMESIIESGCTAIIASNNVMANDVLSYLYDNHISIDKDICVLGYNESKRNLFALNYMNYISQPVSSIGKLAGEQILSLIKNPAQPIKQTILEASFKHR
ncbi:MAG: LacI family DNA-binding transcriptional regulator [Lachnospiraceae bacterium]|nr:LacI family DNA-binding transcriptional regulator [Lachnospiraceae bacterium]